MTFNPAKAVPDEISVKNYIQNKSAIASDYSFRPSVVESRRRSHGANTSFGLQQKKIDGARLARLRNGHSSRLLRHRGRRLYVF
jgi:hypothetical protein